MQNFRGYQDGHWSIYSPIRVSENQPDHFWTEASNPFGPPEMYPRVWERTRLKRATQQPDSKLKVTWGHSRSTLRFKRFEVKPEFIVSNTLTFLTWFWYHTDFFTFECFKWRVRLKVDGMKGCNWTIVRKLTGPDPNRTVISTKEDGHGPWLMDDSERSFKPLWSIVYGPKWTVRLKRSKHVKLL